jgi:hypothetical protein
MLRWGAAILLVAGLVVLPLHAVAATIPMFVMYDAVVSPTATSTLGAHEAARSGAAQGARPCINECDAAGLVYEAPSNSCVAVPVGADHAYDRALLEPRRVGEGAISGAAAATTATEALATESALARGAGTVG